MKFLSSIAAAALLVGLSACTIESTEPGKKSDSTTVISGDALDPGTVSEDETPVIKESKPKMTGGQENAVAKGESYLSHSSFSRSGLIGQLEYEGFSTADATFAVDYIDPAWNKQAVKKAESYLSHSSFSYQGLVDQLIYEGFSPANAKHGADVAYN